MRPVIGQCPICQDTLHVSRLQCRSCDSTIEGHFTLGRLYSLTPEQLEFIETFIRCEGKIKYVEEAMGLSYPAVRARLTAVKSAMGFETAEDDDEGVPDDMRREILSDLSSGEITADEALALLRG